MLRIFFTYCILLHSLFALSQNAIVKGPYLINGTPTSIIVKWETNISSTSKLYFRKSVQNTFDSIIDTGKTLFHEIKIFNLNPFTKYYYVIGSIDSLLQGDSANNFITVASKNFGGKYRFWITGDCGNNSTNQKNVRDAFKYYSKDSPFHGWLLLGDNAYNNGTDLEYTTNFFQIYQADVMKNLTLWPAPGNHDYGSDPNAQITKDIAYCKIFPTSQNGECGGVPSASPTYYSFDYDNIHFLSLDSYGIDSNLYRLYDTTGPQVSWIKKDLEANDKLWTVVYWHHPPFTMTSHNSDLEFELISLRQNFVQILERYGVDFIFCGHSHAYERSKLMKGHYGLESEFDSTIHALSKSSAQYNGSLNSCPYVKNSKTNSGTIYIVSGSAGSLGGAQLTYPHNAMYYSNYTIGGSTILEIEKNRADIKWLCADSVIRDSFTVFKNINIKKEYILDSPELISLSASWIGSYQWPHDLSNHQFMSHFFCSDTVFTVQDTFNCNADTFKLKIKIKKIDSTSNLQNINEKFNLFPNPFSNNFTINTGEFKEKIHSVWLVDIKGTKFSIPSDCFNQLENQILIDLQNMSLSVGSYQLILKKKNNQLMNYPILISN